MRLKVEEGFTGWTNSRNLMFRLVTAFKSDCKEVDGGIRGSDEKLNLSKER